MHFGCLIIIGFGGVAINWHLAELPRPGDGHKLWLGVLAPPGIQQNYAIAQNPFRLINAKS